MDTKSMKTKKKAFKNILNICLLDFSTPWFEVQSPGSGFFGQPGSSSLLECVTVTVREDDRSNTGSRSGASAAGQPTRLTNALASNLPSMYCTSKKSWPIIYNKLLYKRGQDFLEI